MLPSLKKVDSGLNGIFDILIVNDKHFYPLWHFHPQYEIMLIESSTGTRYVGDNISSFKKGEITILGPDIPHLFRNHPEYYLKKSKLRSKATVVYFSKDFVENTIEKYPEFSNIRELLKKSQRGIILKGKSITQAARLLKDGARCHGLSQYLKLISLLNFIANECEFTPLSSIGFSKTVNIEDVSLINKVFDFTLNNFSRNIRLEEVASIVHMSPTTFCRFFKKRTNKTYISFLNELRVGFACKLLIESPHLNVSQVCFESGFNNLTNFNIQFKRLKKVSPLGFRSSYNLSDKIEVQS
jgi:AraC-like DNA-binding protein